MAFDVGFNFRATAGFVVDQAFAVPVLGEQYPTTYTNTNGDSVNAGWEDVRSAVDRVNTNDPRIAGINFSNVGDKTFQVDLSSGSAPGAGTYTIDIANGDAASPNDQGYKFYDDATLLIDASNGGAGFPSLPAGQFIDATVATVAATVLWTGTTVNKTFATTTAKLTLHFTGGANTLAHLRLAAVAGGGGGNNTGGGRISGLKHHPSFISVIA